MLRATETAWTVTPESFESAAALWADPSVSLEWNPVFVLPVWLAVWWRSFAVDARLDLTAVREGDRVLGLSPLMVKDGTASFIGSTDVCDYLDFVVSAGSEPRFCEALLDHLAGQGILHLDLRPVRPESVALTHLSTLARERGCEVSVTQEDVTLELDLPSTWDEYLATLDAKQRHEVRRKQRRMEEAGGLEYRVATTGTAVDALMDAFLTMFSTSRQDKAAFLTPKMESFMRSVSHEMAAAGLLTLAATELDGVPVAMILCMDYGGTVYLYNSGFDLRYGHLSPGLICKLSCIRDSIGSGKRRFEFLKGNEAYKHRLGGREVPIYGCQIDLSRYQRGDVG